jgi:hypothetical protein
VLGASRRATTANRKDDRMDNGSGMVTRRKRVESVTCIMYIKKKKNKRGCVVM